MQMISSEIIKVISHSCEQNREIPSFNESKLKKKTKNIGITLKKIIKLSKTCACYLVKNWIYDMVILIFEIPNSPTPLPRTPHPTNYKNLRIAHEHANPKTPKISR